MQVSKTNTETIIRNMRADGDGSRADYIELMQARIDELEKDYEMVSKANVLMQKDVDRLSEDSRQYHHLLRNGVDNWQGYSYLGDDEGEEDG